MIKMKDGIKVGIVLSEKQREEIILLLADCEKKDGQKIDFFMKQEWNEIPDCPCFFLLYEGEWLDCAVSVFLANGEAELSAVTRYEKRRKGFFTRVLKRVFRTIQLYGIEKVIFRIDAENKVAEKILKHWKAEKVQTDCLMVLIPDDKKLLESQKKEFAEKRKIGKEKNSRETDKQQGKEKELTQERIKCLTHTEVLKRKQELVRFHASVFEGTIEESEWILESGFLEGIQIWEYQLDYKIIGMCFVSESDGEYFLFAVSIDKMMQQKGYGFRFLTLLIRQLWKKEKKVISLQVTEENIAAVRLYKKLGFSVQQKLIAYLLDRSGQIWKNYR